MRTFGRQGAFVVTHPGAFTLRVLRAFRANQGLLLAGAVAYYTLLSIVPLLILIVPAPERVVPAETVQFPPGNSMTAPGDTS